MRSLALAAALVLSCQSAAEKELAEKDKEIEELQAQVELKEKDAEIEKLKNELSDEDGRPSADDCERFADHMVELTVKEVAIEGMEAAIREEATKQRPEFVKACNDKGTEAEVECALKAQSLDALSKCE